MGEVLKTHSVKWGEREERMVLEIQTQTQPFEVSRSQVVRVAIRRLHIVICMPGSVSEDAAPAQELQGHPQPHRVTPQGKRKSA